MEVVNAELVRAELERILASSEFSRAPRHRRFLTYVVEETLHGRGPELKEYVIGLAVFDKAEQFDPKTDSTVRTEASKLRARLERYYGMQSAGAVLRISIPKGSYTAIFEPDAPVVPTGAPARGARWWWVALPAALLALIAILLLLPRRPELAKPTRLVPLTTMPGKEMLPRFSPDGRRLAFCWEDQQGKVQLLIRDLEGGTPVPLGEGQPVFPAWSPDGRSIAYIQGSTVMQIAASGGTPRHIADVEAANWLAWSPDNRFLAVAERPRGKPRDIALISLPSGQKRQLTSPPLYSPGDGYCAFSPDGRRLAFARREGEGRHALMTVPVAGGSEHVILRNEYWAFGLDWMPSGRELIVAWQTGPEKRLFRVPVGSGSGKPQPLGGVDMDARNPAVWAAPGDLPLRIAFETRGEDENLYIQSVGGHAAEFAPSTRKEFFPRFAPNGRDLAFSSGRTGSFQLWRAAENGSDPRQLTNLPDTVSEVRAARWSPDGGSIAFEAFEDGHWAVLVIPALGGTPIRLINDHTDQRWPSWSADGKWIYYTSAQTGRNEIWKAPAAGGPALQVTRNGGHEALESPDGKWLFYNRGEIVSPLLRVPVGGGAESMVHPAIGQNGWDLGEQGVYFADLGQQPPALMLIPYTGGSPRKVMSLPAGAETLKLGLSVSRDGTRTAFCMKAYAIADVMMAEYQK